MDPLAFSVAVLFVFIYDAPLFWRTDETRANICGFCFGFWRPRLRAGVLQTLPLSEAVKCQEISMSDGAIVRQVENSPRRIKRDLLWLLFFGRRRQQTKGNVVNQSSTCSS